MPKHKLNKICLQDFLSISNLQNPRTLMLIKFCGKSGVTSCPYSSRTEWGEKSRIRIDKWSNLEPLVQHHLNVWVCLWYSWPSPLAQTYFVSWPVCLSLSCDSFILSLHPWKWAQVPCNSWGWVQVALQLHWWADCYPLSHPECLRIELRGMVYVPRLGSSPTTEVMPVGRQIASFLCTLSDLDLS